MEDARSKLDFLRDLMGYITQLQTMRYIFQEVDNSEVMQQAVPHLLAVEKELRLLLISAGEEELKKIKDMADWHSQNISTRDTSKDDYNEFLKEFTFWKTWLDQTPEL